MDIPAHIDSYTVRQITTSFPSGADSLSLVIPDTVTYIEGDSFRGANIGKLYYRAEEASTTEDYFRAPFRVANIGELHINTDVRIILERMFCQTKFTEDVELEVETVAS